MSKSTTLVIPIYWEVPPEKYRVAYLQFSMNDGSIFVTFPRKDGYTVSALVNLGPPWIGEKKVELVKQYTLHKLPKISFHPGKGVIHFNSSLGAVKFDEPILNMASSTIVFPLCQVILPTTANFLDKVSSNKYGSPLVLPFKVPTPAVGLSLEFWIHPVGKYIDKNDLPLRKAVKDKVKFVNMAKLNHRLLTQFTCTVVISEISATIRNPNTVLGITVAVFNNGTPYAFQLSPILKI